jgi:hypothetical protein
MAANLGHVIPAIETYSTYVVQIVVNGPGWGTDQEVFMQVDAEMKAIATRIVIEWHHNTFPGTTVTHLGTCEGTLA